MSTGLNIVLVYPEIPNNTGNIGRLCVGTDSHLHLVHPLGFQIDDSKVKRAGLDYWPELKLAEHQDFESFEHSLPADARLFFFSSHGSASLYQAEIRPGDYLIFGQESVGLPEPIRERYADRLLRIPFPGKVRSFNLSNAVAMVLGESMRQSGL